MTFRQHMSRNLTLENMTKKNIVINSRFTNEAAKCISHLQNTNLNFLDRFFKNAQIPNLQKTHSVGGRLFHASGWTDRETETDMTKLGVTSHNFVNVPKKPLTYMPIIFPVTNFESVLSRGFPI